MSELHNYMEIFRETRRTPSTVSPRCPRRHHAWPWQGYHCMCREKQLASDSHTLLKGIQESFYNQRGSRSVL